MKKELFIAMASIVIVVFAGAFLLLGGLETKGHERNAVVMVAGLISLFVAVTISIIAGRINPNIKEMAKTLRCKCYCSRSNRMPYQWH